MKCKHYTNSYNNLLKRTVLAFEADIFKLESCKGRFLLLDNINTVISILWKNISKKVISRQPVSYLLLITSQAPQFALREANISRSFAWCYCP